MLDRAHLRFSALWAPSFQLHLRALILLESSWFIAGGTKHGSYDFREHSEPWPCFPSNYILHMQDVINLINGIMMYGESSKAAADSPATQQQIPQLVTLLGITSIGDTTTILPSSGAWQSSWPFHLLLLSPWSYSMVLARHTVQLILLWVETLGPLVRFYHVVAWYYVFLSA